MAHHHFQSESQTLYFTFDNKDKGQSLSEAPLHILLEQIQRRQPTSLVFYSQSSLFLTGGDLKSYKKLKSKEDGLRIHQQLRGLLDELDQLPLYKCAQVTGHCFGGGIELLSVCDYIQAAPHVLFGLWQARQGLSFGWKGASRLRRRLSESVTKSWMLQGGTKSSSWAHSMGLVDQVVPLHSMGTYLDQHLKRALNHNHLLSPQAHLDQDETKLFEGLWWSEKHLAHLNKFPD